MISEGESVSLGNAKCRGLESDPPTPRFRLRYLARYLPMDFQWVLRDIYYGWQIRQGRFFSDEPEFERLGEWVTQGDWVLDVGASIGHYTIRLASLVGIHGRVFAFEPVLETFALLARNVRRAGCQNVTLLNMAVSDRAHMNGIEIPAGRTGLDAHYFAHLTGTPNERPVFCCPIDAFDFCSRIRLVKVDVEGHEPAVLSGMQRLLERDRPVLIVEHATDELGRRLASLGYESMRFNGSHNTVYIQCCRPTDL